MISPKSYAQITFKANETSLNMQKEEIKEEIKEETDICFNVEVEDSGINLSEHQENPLHQHHQDIQIKEEPDFIKEDEDQLQELPCYSVNVEIEEPFLLDPNPTEEIQAKFCEESKLFSLPEHLEPETSAATGNSSDTDSDDDTNNRSMAKKSSKKYRKTKINREKCEDQIKNVVGEVSENAFSKEKEETAQKNAEETRNVNLAVRNVRRKKCKCRVCGKTFRYNSDLKRHMTVHSGKKPYSCTVCSKTFARKGHMTAHMFLHTGEKPFRCSGCTLSFAEKSSLVKHTMIAHPDQKPFSCSVCNEKFKDRKSLKKHKQQHKKNRLFSCTECGTEFNRNQHLLRHMGIHTGEKPYSCTVCKKGFMRKDHVRIHMKTHMRRSALHTEVQ